MASAHLNAEPSRTRSPPRPHSLTSLDSREGGGTQPTYDLGPTTYYDRARRGRGTRPRMPIVPLVPSAFFASASASASASSRCRNPRAPDPSPPRSTAPPSPRSTPGHTQASVGAPPPAFARLWRVWPNTSENQQQQQQLNYDYNYKCEYKIKQNNDVSDRSDRPDAGGPGHFDPTSPTSPGEQNNTRV